MRQVNYNAIPLQTAATVTSGPIDSRNLFYASAQVSITGSGAGTLVIQASNDDPTVFPFTPVNWTAIPSATVTTSGAGAYLIPKTDLCYEYVRLVYTNTGTGTMSVVFKALGD
jgi:hypothetical protein